MSKYIKKEDSFLYVCMLATWLIVCWLGCVEVADLRNRVEEAEIKQHEIILKTEKPKWWQLRKRRAWKKEAQ